ncbi:hypothetical protein CVD19_21620, partial [Bacillus sp. T33-2]
LESRIDGLEDRFDGLENRFDGLEDRFDGLENRFDGLENRVDRLEENHNKRFDNLELGQERILSELRSSIRHMNETVQVHTFAIEMLHKEVKQGIIDDYNGDET